MENIDVYEAIRRAKVIYDDVAAGTRAASEAISSVISGVKSIAYLAGCARTFADAAKLIEASLPEEAKDNYRFFYESAGDIGSMSVVSYDDPGEETGAQKGE